MLWITSTKSDTLTISDSFLDSKMPAFTALIPDAASNLERYVRVNNEVRLANEQTLLEIGQGYRVNHALGRCLQTVARFRLQGWIRRSPNLHA